MPLFYLILNTQRPTQSNISAENTRREINRPSFVNLKPLVHKHDKAGNKCHTKDNTDTRETPSVRIRAHEE